MQKLIKNNVWSDFVCRCSFLYTVTTALHLRPVPVEEIPSVMLLNMTQSTKTKNETFWNQLFNESIIWIHINNSNNWSNFLKYCLKHIHNWNTSLWCCIYYCISLVESWLFLWREADPESIMQWDEAEINGLVQERCNSIANALELHLSGTKPSK